MNALQYDWYDSNDAYSYEVKPTGGLNNDNSLWGFGDELRKYVCTCGRTYKSKGSMVDHQRWECGKDPTFQCPYCDYCAKRKKHLRRHVVCVHKQTFID